MTRAQPITVRPDLIRWARSSAGLSVAEAARKAAVTAEAFSGWEVHGARRTPRQLEKLADALKRPVASFFLPSAPAEPALPVDFRRPAEARALSFATRLAIRRARHLREAFTEIGTAMGEAASSLEQPRAIGQAEAAGTAARSRLGLTDPIQRSWKGDPRTAYQAVRHLLEGQGTLVLQFAMDADETSGFSLEGTPPLIAVNRRESPVRRLFTLAHEWAHLLLGQPGLCELDEAEWTDRDDPEVYCNAFAAALLVPREWFDAEVVRPRDDLPTMVERGVRCFAVSRYVILRRLLTARVIDRTTYQQTVSAWKAVPTPRKPAGRIHRHRQALADLGASFVGRVVAGHERGLIGDTELTSLLGLRLKHLPRLLESLPGG